MLQLDYANCLSDRVGEHGLDREHLAGAGPALGRMVETMNAGRQAGPGRFRLLPFDPLRTAHRRAIDALVERHRPAARNLVVLGIGGSALGALALRDALTPPTWNLLPHDRRRGPRLFVLDNVDPVLVGSTLEEVRRTDPGLDETVFTVISKSGETAETAAQLMIVRAMLAGVPGGRARVVAITDPESGTLRRLSREAGFDTLPIPAGVGGRFSVLSPVGLFPAAMCGLDVDGVLDGAAAMDERCSTPDALANPAAVLAWILVELTRRGRSGHVLMSYSNQLASFADWYAQLWGESLGKRLDLDGNEVFAGPTPIRAVGTTDQHSQLQLYREGPPDKVVGFLEVGSFPDPQPIPAGLGVESLAYLEGSSLADLLAAEKRATEYALVESRRPNYTIRFPEIDARHVGEFIQLWEIATACAALLLNVNAFDQPAVETGKDATYGLMGRPGYEPWKAKVDAALPPSKDVV